MSFAQPFAFIGLAALPLLLLHMLRRQRAVVAVSNAFLWQRPALREAPRRPRRRFPLNVELALQSLFVLLLVTALARPQVAGPRPARVVIVVDLSASMGAVANGDTRLDLARRRALEVADRFALPPRVSVVGSADRPIVVADDLDSRRALRDALAGLSPHASTADLPAALQTAMGLRAGGVPDEVWIFSDGARNAAPPEATTIAAHYVQVGTGSDNIAITALSARRDPFDSARHQALVEIVNHGARQQAVPLRLLQQDRVLLETTVSLHAGERRRLFVALPDRRSPLEALLQVRDGLEADNRALLPPAGNIDVLAVSEDNELLRRALDLEPRVDARHVTPDAYAAGIVGATPEVLLLDGLLPVDDDAQRVLVVDPPTDAAPWRAREVMVVDPAHPLTAGIDWRADALGNVAAVRDVAGAEVLVEADGEPVLVTYRAGTRRVIVAGLDLRTARFARTPAWPIFLSNALDWLVEEDAPLRAPPPEVTGNPLDAAESDLGTVHSTRAQEPSAPPAAPRGDPRALYRVLLLLALMTLAAEAYVSGLTRRPLRRRAMLTLRLATMLLLLAGLIGVPLPGGPPTRTIMWAADGSDSVGASLQAAQRRHLEAATGSMTAADRGGLVLFGETAHIAAEPGPRRDLDHLLASQPGAVTDISSALRLAAAKLPARGDRVVLLSDGNEGAGDVLLEARALAARGIAIDAVILDGAEEEATGAVSAVAVVAPQRVARGVFFEVTVALTGRFGTAASIALYRDGELVDQAERVLQRNGGNSVSFQTRLEAAGLHTFTARVTARTDNDARDNEAGAVVRAVAAPSALLITSRPGPSLTARLLQDAGVDVEMKSSAEVPGDPTSLAPWDLVVLDGVAAATLAPAQQSALARYVSEIGGGLVVSGGPRALGPAGFAGSALESSLPLDLRPPERIERDPLAIVLALDASGSMALSEGGVTKIESARRAVNGLVAALEPDDRVGLIAFADEPRVIAPLQSVASHPALGETLARLSAGGGTAIAPALEMAYRQLTTAPGDKYVLLVSDGRDEGEAPATAARPLDDSDVTLSVIGIGADVDWEFLARLAQDGGGRTYRADAASELADILLREAALISGRWIVERSFVPRGDAGHEVTRDLIPDALPSLHGYVATVRKPAADTLLASDLGDPVLAAWHAGLGRSAVLTTDLSSAWAEELVQSRAFATLWTRLLRWTARRLDGASLYPSIVLRGNDAHLILDAVDPSAGFVNDLEVTALCRGPAGEVSELRLSQSAPGRYEASFDASAAGTYRVRLDTRPARRGGETPGGPDGLRQSVQVGVYVARPAELRARGTDMETLQRITEATGGRLLAVDDNPFALVAPDRGATDRWRLPAALALVALLIEVALRHGLGRASLPAAGELTATSRTQFRPDRT